MPLCHFRLSSILLFSNRSNSPRERSVRLSRSRLFISPSIPTRKNFIQSLYQTVDLRWGNNQRGNESQNGLNGAIDQEAPFQAIHDHPFSFPVQLHADHQPFAPNLLDEGIFLFQTLQAVHKMGGGTLAILQNSVFNRGPKGCNPRGRGQRIPPKG